MSVRGQAWDTHAVATLTGTLDPVRLRRVIVGAREEIDHHASRSGRVGTDVELLLAGKYVTPTDAPRLVEAGVTVCGENRLQDLVAKRAIVGDLVVFDFIGHVQRRKVRDVLRHVRLIHSLDSFELAQEIARCSAGRVRVLVEVNVASEPTKHGIPLSLLSRFVEQVSSLPSIEVVGLMCMPPYVTDPEQSRGHFAALRALGEDLSLEWSGRHTISHLSMGTSQDFLVAVEEGATIVRLGRGLLDQAKAG